MPSQPRLSLEDARAIDALLEHGRDAQYGSQRSSQNVSDAASTDASDPVHGHPLPAEPARIAKAEALGRLLDRWPAGNIPLDLMNRTLARVSKARHQQHTRTEPLKLSFSPGRLTEVAAIAAIVLISFSLAIPMLTHARDNQRRIVCQDNLRQTGIALASYSQDNQGSMPRGHISPNDAWWRVGSQPAKGENVQSNSAHLYRLARQGYINPDVMACPDNASAPRHMTTQMHDWPSAQAVSYSYQNQYTPRPYKMDTVGDMAVLADKNPLFQIHQNQGITYRRDLSPNSASRLHRSNGQNVLSAAGHATWKTDPLRNHNDNIWLLNRVHDYRGNEVPAEQDDTFLVP